MQSLRLARHARGLSAIVILILALGIGLTTAMFTLLHGVLLEPLPYHDPSRLVRFYGVWPNSSREGTSTPDFVDYRQAASFESLAAATRFTPLYQSPGSDGPEQLTGRAVSSRFLETLGLKPAAGTEFTADDERQNSTPRSQPRFRGYLLALFAAVALALASLGLYGFISYLVAQRTKELGIRMALGSTRRDVVQLILTFGGRLVGTGLVAGLAAAWGLTRLLSSSVFGISLRDPLTFASASLTLVTTGLAACYVPARRASQLDPLRVLQNER